MEMIKTVCTNLHVESFVKFENIVFLWSKFLVEFGRDFSDFVRMF